jgi:hypothetical protein
MDAGSFRVRVKRPKISRRSLWFLLPGLLLISLDISLIGWLVTLPGNLGGLFFPTALAVGVMLILFSPQLVKVKPPQLSGIYGEQLEKWEKSGDIVIMLQGLSSNETSNLVDWTSRHFGTYIQKRFVGRKGKIWTEKGHKVGFGILPVGLDKGRPVFNVILYRRDLASIRGVKRPWRTISGRDGSLQIMKAGPLLELPNWIAG